MRRAKKCAKGGGTVVVNDPVEGQKKEPNAERYGSSEEPNNLVQMATAAQPLETPERDEPRRAHSGERQRRQPDGLLTRPSLPTSWSLPRCSAALPSLAIGRIRIKYNKLSRSADLGDIKSGRGFSTHERGRMSVELTPDTGNTCSEEKRLDK